MIMEFKIGNIYKYKNRIVFLASIRNGEYMVSDFFIKKIDFVQPEDLSSLDDDVAKFTSLVIMAPQLTYDEIKAQIQLLFNKGVP